MKNTGTQNLLDSLGQMSAPELRRLLTEHLTRQKLGLYWERDAIEHDKALNANVVLPRLVPEWSHTPEGCTEHRNLIIEGDNFDSLRLLRSTHAGKVRVIYIDPPYNTGNKDWVYNDSYVGQNDRWRHSQWLEFLYQRLTLARELLSSDGVILVSINDENRARLELLMDEVFPGRRLGSFVWKTRSGSNDETGGRLSIDHESVLVYANSGFQFNGDIKDFSQYKNTDNDPRGRWKTGDLSKSHTFLERPNGYYPIQNPTNGVWYPCNPSRIWAFASEKLTYGRPAPQLQPGATRHAGHRLTGSVGAHANISVMVALCERCHTTAVGAGFVRRPDLDARHPGCRTCAEKARSHRQASHAF
jgi:adenine-specific DNA-methyltransferase